MASVTFTFNPVPAPACYPPDLNSLAKELTTGGILAGEIPDTAGGGVIVSSSVPASTLSSKVWFKIDTAGRPLGTYIFYNGNWRKVYTGLPSEIRMFSGDWTIYFDGSGLGVVGGEWDGWALCNGNNGTQNLANRFIVCGEEFSGEWLTIVDQFNLTNSGGVGSEQLTQVGPGSQGWGFQAADIGGNWHNNCPPFIAMGFAQFVGYA